jgi:hypothetical protein
LDDHCAGKFPPDIKPEGPQPVPGIEPASDKVIPAIRDAKANASTASRDLAAETRPRFAGSSAVLGRGGRRECRMQAAPMARLQQKTQAAVTTGTAERSGIPCAMVYGLYVVSPVYRAF